MKIEIGKTYRIRQSQSFDRFGGALATVTGYSDIVDWVVVSVWVPDSFVPGDQDVLNRQVHLPSNKLEEIPHMLVW